MILMYLLELQKKSWKVKMKLFLSGVGVFQCFLYWIDWSKVCFFGGYCIMCENMD